MPGLDVNDCVAGGIVCVCAVEFMCGWIYVGGRGKAAWRLERSRVEIGFLRLMPLAVTASPLNSEASQQFPTHENKQKPPAAQANDC